MTYEEYEKKLDAGPAWKIINDIVERIIEISSSFRGWVYHYDSRNNYYVKIEEYEDKEKHDYLNALHKYIYTASLCIIKADRINQYEQLLSAYNRVSYGNINNNLKSEVFAAPIEIGDWAMVEKGKVLLVICHDANPLFILRKSWTPII